MNYTIKKKAKSISSNLLLLMMGLLFTGLKGLGQNINVPNTTGPMGLQVNSYTGNLFFERTDFMIPGTGLDMNVSFAYNSFNFNTNRGFGNGWSFEYDVHYTKDTANNIIILWGDGREDIYQPTGNGNYKSPRGFFSVLREYAPGQFSITEKYGTKYLFENNTHKRLTKIEDVNQNFVTINYTDTLITSLENNYGHVITLAYTNGLLATVTDAITTPTRTWHYSYDEVGNLTAVKNPLNASDTYTYIINGPMKTVTDKNFNVVDLIYYNDFSLHEMIGCNKRMSFSYDAQQKMTVVTNHMENGQNQVNKYFFSQFGDNLWLKAISSNCCGFDITMVYDNQGNKIKQTDANGNSTTYTYDANGNMLTKTNALGETINITYTTDLNLISSIRDPKGFVTTFEYDGNGNLIKITEPENSIYTATYDAAGHIISSTNPEGNTFTYAYDANGNMQTINGPESFHISANISPRGDLLSFTDPENNTSSFQYDILNRMTQLTDPLNNQINVSYDANGNPFLIRNKKNEPYRINYDASDRPNEISGPLESNIKLNYDEMDNVIGITSALGAHAAFEFNSRNLMSSFTDAEGNQTTFSYDQKGNLITVNRPSGQTLTYTYDALDRITTVSDENGTYGTLEYDANGNISKYTDASGSVNNFTYDNRNRVTKYTDALGHTMEIAYNENGTTRSITDKNGHTSTLVYDDLDRIVSLTDNNGAITKVAYDASGNIISLTDANNNTTQYTYDALNRQIRATFPDGKYTEYTYDKNDNIIAFRQKDGSSISYIYDSLNRVVTKTLPDGQVFDYEYDNTGKVISATNNEGTVHITYDLLNRITSETFNGKTINYTYDISGRTQSTTYPDGTEITKSFDTRNRLISIAKNDAILVRYTYNNAGQVTGKAFANGVNTTLQYDFAGRLTNMTTGSFQNLSFDYDHNGNRTSIIRGNTALSEFFTYDNANRLIAYKQGQAGGPFTINDTYTYDALGNRITASIGGQNINYTTNNLNQITAMNDGTGATNFVYGDNGNLLFDGKYHKFYNAARQLLKDSASPSEVVLYQYDAFGRMVGKTVNGVASFYTYSGFLPVVERDGDGIVKNRTIFKGLLEPVVNEHDEVPFYYHRNHLFSVSGITDATGNLTEQYRYDIYGKQTIYDGSGNVMAGSATGNRYGFTGQVYDSSTGHNQFFFRSYNPETGLFNQQDLIGYGDGMGMYQYVGNNPANGIDVFGLDAGVPCANFNYKTKSEKVRIVTRNVIANQQQQMLNEANDRWWKRIWGIGDIMAAGVADSKLFYQDFANRDDNGNRKNGAVGGHEFFFDGEVMNSWEINYYFTQYASASMGGNKATLTSTTAGWNYLKGAASLNLTSRIDEAAGKIDLTKKAFEDFHSGLMSENLVIPKISAEFQWKQTAEGEWWPVRNKNGDITYEFFIDISLVERFRNDKKFRKYLIKKIKDDCPQNPPGSSGTQRNPPGGRINDHTAQTEIIRSNDPNEIIGPEGRPDKRWVSVKDRLPYTVTFENSEMASAPAKYVKVIVPVHEKMDAGTFLLANFGFNNQSFTVPAATSSSYQRLDARDSLGMFIDLVAGYDVVNKEFFWEFQSIDPVTLMPPSDPLKGFLLLQDTTEEKTKNGHGFVTFSIKPEADAQTLDSILAFAKIVFDQNDTIPTNIEKNVIDAVAPSSEMESLEASYTDFIPLSWSGQDDVNGCGVDYYTLYISTDGINFTVLKDKIFRTDTTFTGLPNTTYYFFVLATDSVGNTETLGPGAVMNTFLGSVLPVSWLYFKGTNKGTDNLLEWATAQESNAKAYRIERSFDATNFSTIGSVKASGNTSGNSSYQYTDYDVDELGRHDMYYRLAQVDEDGRVQYSNVVHLVYEGEKVHKTIVYPNPTEGMFSVKVGNPALIGTMATIVDEAGKVLMKVEITSNNQSFNLSRYTNGIYFLRFENKEVFRIVKH